MLGGDTGKVGCFVMSIDNLVLVMLGQWSQQELLKKGRPFSISLLVLRYDCMNLVVKIAAS